MNDEMATHVMQFFLVSADGAASVPIGFYPMTGINGEKVFSIIEPLFKMLQEGNHTGSDRHNQRRLSLQHETH